MRQRLSKTIECSTPPLASIIDVARMKRFLSLLVVLGLVCRVYAASPDELSKAVLEEVKASKLPDAQLKLDELDRQYPNSFQSYITHGCLYSALGQLKQAEQAYEEAVKQANSKIQKAGAGLLLKVTLDQEKNIELTTLGNQAEQKGNFHQAAVYFRDAWKITPGIKSSAISALHCFVRAGEATSAVAIIRQLLQVDPANAASYNALLGEVTQLKSLEKTLESMSVAQPTTKRKSESMSDAFLNH